MASLPAPSERRGMDDNELAALLAGHEERSVGYYNSEIANEQATAINYYYGKMDDLPALEGCSSVVDGTVGVMVDNALAAILKPFVSSGEVGSFEPRSEEDVEQADQATEYVNYILSCDNPGFLILHDWFKDALLTKLGIVKVWWEDQTKQEVKRVPADAMGVIQAREAEGYQGEEEVEPGVFLVSQMVTIPDGRVKIQNVPPEEFLITPYARSLEEAPYVAHRPSNFTRSNLIEMGVDVEVAYSLPAYSQGVGDESRSQARYRDEDWGSQGRDNPSSDKSQDIIGVLDEYVRCDFDGDGIAELRRVVRVDDVILLNEEVDDSPFSTLCPVPMPHKVYGLSVADRAIEGQKVGTALKRQTLDNLYKSNNPRPVIGEPGLGESTMDDLESTAPGAAIQVKGLPGQVIDWLIVPFNASHSFPMLEANAREVEERTGIQRQGMGFNAEALEKNSPDTATQAAIDENSRNERAEMIARIFAETGVKRLFKLILKLVVAHQPKERVIRLRNKWIPVDPRGWNAEMDMTISVGLGVGNKAEQIGQADSVLATMAELQATPYGYLIGPDEVYNALKRKFTATGIKNISDFLKDPKETEPPAPQPDPAMAKVQADAQLQQQKQQGEQEMAGVKLQGEQQIAAFKLQTQREEAAAKLQAMREEAAAQQQLAREKAEFEAQLAIEQMNREFALEQERMERQSVLDQQKADREDELSKKRAGGDLSK